ncbi:isocitrate lyase/phosphoenolpyruvate mutase family protein [Hyphococcus flavus]|uniref:Isocitrate lyase/phosphoenolpyruvate mutase family protein n=1 Tax=Hyphococcus flavus TaxID=1866326 RepID=A0AAE9ZJZ2_9PROT|nr:isocitrate lyase/phosphoenolpyruvate mutase family protein [Hyphococcus flavus]WDI32526.1 isocitrate lyase/phosphoenolpyruvate mutase family protein [Hyphococcus flavus]
MTIDASKIATFRKQHQSDEPFVIPNPWDAGSARMLEGLGFQALATTSSGFAMTMGRRDYGVTRDQALAHGDLIARSVDIPVTADLENGFGLTPQDAAETIRLATETALCGGSIEDSTGDKAKPVIEDDVLAVERISAAVEAIHHAGRDFVLTARAEAFLYGIGEIDKIIARLNAFADAGADILYAPGLPDLDAVRTVCSSVSKPVNVLIIGELTKHSVEEFANAGAARLSIGGGLAWRAYATLADASAMLSTGKFDCLATDRDSAKTIGQSLL